MDEQNVEDCKRVKAMWKTWSKTVEAVEICASRYGPVLICRSVCTCEIVSQATIVQQCSAATVFDVARRFYWKMVSYKRYM